MWETRPVSRCHSQRLHMLGLRPLRVTPNRRHKAPLTPEKWVLGSTRYIGEANPVLAMILRGGRRFGLRWSARQYGASLSCCDILLASCPSGLPPELQSPSLDAGGHPPVGGSHHGGKCRKHGYGYFGICLEYLQESLTLEVIALHRLERADRGRAGLPVDEG